MAKRRVVVKRLAAIHDLGAMDVLCTDKTGTLTEARITLAGHPDSSGADNPRVLDLAQGECGLAAGVPGPLDVAILSAGGTDYSGRWMMSPAISERRCLRAGGARRAAAADHEGRAGGGAGPLHERGDRGGRAPAGCHPARFAGLRPGYEKASAGLRMLAVATRPLAAEQASPRG